MNFRRMLIGTWKSDKRLTLENCCRYHRLTGAKKRKFGSLFGTLVLRFTRTRVHHALRGTEWSAKYEVVAAVSESLVLRVHSDDLWKKASPMTADILKELAEPRLLQLHFRRRFGRHYYWIAFGTVCEWFERRSSRGPSVRQGRSRIAAAKRKLMARRA